MPRTHRRINPRLTLTILGLAASAALYTHDVMAQAAQRPAHRVAHVNWHLNTDGDFALVRDTANGTSINGSSVDAHYIDDIKRSVKGEFLWFRDGGKNYVVQDATVLARARQAWVPVDRLGEQMDAHGKQMEQHGKVMEALGKEMDSAGRDKRFAAMEEIGRKMEQAGKPMDALGKQMDALGKQLEREAHAAEATMRTLIRESLAKGLARPAPERG
jgi:hypothetical protein